MAKFSFRVWFGAHKAEHEEVVEIPDEELAGREGAARIKFVQEEYFEPWLRAQVEGGWQEVEEP